MSFLNTSRDGDYTDPLGSVFQCFPTFSVNTFFLISKLNLSWHNLQPLSPVPLLAAWEKRPTLTSAQTSFKVDIESNEVPPNPPFL